MVLYCLIFIKREQLFQEYSNCHFVLKNLFIRFALLPMPRCGPWNFSVAISWIGICWATFYTRFESSIWDNGNALQHHIASTQSKIEELANYTRHRKPAKSDHCLVLSAYFIFVIFFTQAKFLENKIYTEIYIVNCKFTQ